MSQKSTLICLPMMDMVHTSFMTSLLNLKRVGKCQCAVAQSSLIYDARNNLSMQAIDSGSDYVLWLDSDMQFDSDLMERLSGHLDDGKDIVTALYVKRTIPTGPVIYSEVDITKTDTGLSKPIAVPYDDYPLNSVFEVEGCGFGACMVRTETLKRVTDTFGLPFSPLLGLGEDLSFCYRLKQLGIKIYCDSSIKMMHIGNIGFNEDMYLKQREAEQHG